METTTKFFQRSPNAHKRNNYTDHLVVEGENLVETRDTKDEIIRFCNQIYTETEAETWRPGFNFTEE